MIKLNSDWVCNVKFLLDDIGLSYLWNVATKSDFCLIEKRLLDMQKQIILSNIYNSSKGYLYRYLVDNYTLQNYLQKPIEDFYMKQIARIRLSSHNLNIESGRFSDIDRSQRICTLCNLNDIEDEFRR